MQRRVFSTAAAIATLVVPTTHRQRRALHARWRQDARVSDHDRRSGRVHRTWTSGPRTFTRSDTGFLRYQWVCSARDTREHYEKVGSAGNPGTTSTFK